MARKKTARTEANSTYKIVREKFFCLHYPMHAGSQMTERKNFVESSQLAEGKFERKTVS